MVFHCKMCGANLDISEGMRICKCSYCDSYQTIPDISTDNKLKLFGQANQLRFDCEFDKAADAYRSITKIFPEEAEAYWGLCLCRYGIEYVDDPETGRKIPTCHRTDFDRIFHTSDYNNALEYADEMMKVIYEREAEKIDRIQQNIISISAQEKPFDVFICYKETDTDGYKTEDSIIAHNLYNRLTECGFKVFFAAVTLKKKLGTEFEPYIFSAINSSQVMICVGTSPYNFNAVWVRNEWSRFLDLMKTDKSRVLIPCYKGISVAMLPKELQGFQAQDMSAKNAAENILKSVKEIMSVSSDTKDQLKTLFDQYELQLKSQLTKIHEYEDKMHTQAIEEKKIAPAMYKAEYKSVIDLITFALVVSSTLGGFGTLYADDGLTGFIVWIIAFVFILLITLPNRIRKNRHAEENLARRMAYNDMAASYEEGIKDFEYHYAIKLYNRERISKPKITLIVLLDFIIVLSVSTIICAIKGTSFELLFWILFLVSGAASVWLIKHQNKKAEERLQERISEAKIRKIQ